MPACNQDCRVSGDNPLYKLRGSYSPIYVPPEFDSLVIKTEDLFEFQNKVLSSSESDSVFNSELQALADKITADRIASTGKSPQKNLPWRMRLVERKNLG